jgi:hypothetical protein
LVMLNIVRVINIHVVFFMLAVHKVLKFPGQK